MKQMQVNGMNCGGCVKSVTRILAKQLEVDEEQIDVSLDDKRALVPDGLDASVYEEAAKKLSEQGFPTTLA